MYKKMSYFFIDFCVQFLPIFMAYRSEFDFEIHYSRPLKWWKTLVFNRVSSEYIYELEESYGHCFQNLSCSIL